MLKGERHIQVDRVRPPTMHRVAKTRKRPTRVLKKGKDKTKQKLLGREREMKKFLGRKQRRKENTCNWFDSRLSTLDSRPSTPSLSHSCVRVLCRVVRLSESEKERL